MSSTVLDSDRMDDCLLAEHILGYRRELGPATDYGGPCEQFEVLVPPTITGHNIWSSCPPRGAILPYYWTPDFLNDYSASERLLSAFSGRHGGDVSVKIEVSKNLFVCRVYPGGEHFVFADSFREAVRTALLSWTKARFGEVGDE